MAIRHNANYKQLITGTITFGLAGDVYTGTISFDKFLGCEPNYITEPNFTLMNYEIRMQFFLNASNITQMSFCADYIYWPATPEVATYVTTGCRNITLNQVGGLLYAGNPVTASRTADASAPLLVFQTDSSHNGQTWDYSGYIDCYATGQYI